MKSKSQSFLPTESLPLGPSPWGFINHTVRVHKKSYQFKQTAPDSDLGGLISLQSSTDSTLLVLDFYCYARILEDGTTLLWRGTENKIAFDCFSLSSLQPLEDPLAIAQTVHEEKIGHSPLSVSQHWEFSTHLAAEKPHSLDLPYDWSQFNETLILADHSDSTRIEPRGRAIFAFDWSKRQVEVFRQDWFNHGNYDFGYQWITRIVRRPDGVIVGDGIRLGSFELDSSNCQIKRWLSEDPFYRIK